MPAKRIPIQIPRGGVSEDRAFADQDQNTAQDAANVRGIDCGTGRERLAVRSVTRRYNDNQVNGANKIDRLAAITYGKSNQTLTDPGNALTIEWSKANTVAGDTIGVQCGSQGDSIVIDGSCGITKRNRDGAVMWKITLAAVDKNHAVRALLVDASTPADLGSDFVLAGVSSGGDPATAKCWAYRQLNDNKVEKVWEMSPGGYIEGFTITKDKLFILVNITDQNRSYVIAYDDYLTNTPTEVNRWLVPTNGTSIDSGKEDGFIFTTHGASSDRDKLGGHSKVSWPSEDWTIKDLGSVADKLWCNLDAMNKDTLGIVPRDMAYPGSAASDSAPPGESLDGGNVRMWKDASGQNRNAYQSADKIPQVNTAGTTYTALKAAARGAIYREKGGPNGLPCLGFDGITCGMVSEAASSDDKANRHDQLTILPSYKGASFAVFIVMRASADSVRRGLICQGGTRDTSSTTASRWIGVNTVIGAAPSSAVGTTEAPGQIGVFEVGVAPTAGFNPVEGGIAAAPTGLNAHPLGGSLPDSGFCVISWVCDGGIQDNATNATRSILRVNGHPCDRWQSKPFSTLKPTQIGYWLRGTAATDDGSAAFAGDICQILVFSDWYNSSDTRQPMIGSGADLSMRYPDAAFGGNQDSDLERIEGWLAHRWGIAHELTCGVGAWVTYTAQPAGGNTVRVDGTTYTWRAALAGVANEVLIGTTLNASMVNLYRAINATGTPDTDYDAKTLVNATFRANAPVAINATPHYAIYVRARNPNANYGVVLATTGSGAWDSTTPRFNFAPGVAGGNTGLFPHPFFLERTFYTSGGPPRSGGVATISKYWLLRSPYPILAAWDPASGKCKDAITSGYDDGSFGGIGQGSSVGGIGSCVRAGSSGMVYTCGPRAVAVPADSIWSDLGTPGADNNDARRIKWQNQQFTKTAASGTWVWGSGSGSIVSPGEISYGYPRMAVDKFDNLYLPYSNAGTTDSLWIFAAAGSGGNAVVISRYSSLPDTNDGYAVAVDPNYPDFTDFPSLQRAEFVVLGTQQAGTSRNSNFKLKTLTVTVAAASARGIKLIAVSAGNIAAVTPTVITTKGTGATGFSSAPNLVMATPYLGKLYLTDGIKTKVYDPRLDTLADHVATSGGGAPTGYQLLTTWNDSLVFARHRDNPSQYLIGGQGDPGNFDTDPYVVTQAMAILGSNGSAGIPTDIINAFIPWFDDIAIIGGDSTIRMMTGRPSPGSNGAIHLVSSTLGIAFGKAWCISPGNRLFFFENRGGVYYMNPGGGPVPLSTTTDKNSTRGRIERRLRNINLSLYRIEMAWDPADKGLRVKVLPVAAPDQPAEHYFWEQATGGWWPDTYANLNLQPTCVDVFDGDDPDDRVVMIGCVDGRIRVFDQFLEADNSTRLGAIDANSVPVNAKVRIGPIVPKEADFEALFSALEAVLANDLDGRPWISIYCTDRADFLGPAVYTKQLERGRNPFLNFRRRGALMFIDITSSDRMGRWAVEQLSVMVEAMGMKRMVPR